MGWIESRRETQREARKARALEAYQNARAAAGVAARQAAEAEASGYNAPGTYNIDAMLAQRRADQLEREAALLGARPSDGAVEAGDADLLVRLRQAEEGFRAALEDARSALEGALHEAGPPQSEGG